MPRQALALVAGPFSFLTCVVLTTSLLYGPSCQGSTIGINAPIGWQGTGARILTGPGQIVAEDVNLGVPNSYSETAYFGPNSTGWSQAEPYSLHGAIDVSPDLPVGDTHSSGSFFRDEIYVASASGNPVRLEFEFELSAYLELWDLDQGESFGELWLGWGYYPDGADSHANGTYRALDFSGIRSTPVEYVDQFDPDDDPFTYYEYQFEQEDWDEGTQVFMQIDETQEGYLDYFELITMTTDGHSNGGLVASGSWLPVSFGLWGNAREAGVDWGQESLHLFDVYVYDGVTGQPLGTEEYTAVSQNNLFPSNGEIPEPATLAITLFATVAILLRRGNKT